MYLKILPLILILLFSSINVEAKNFLGLLGGGGEPAGDSTMFDSHLNDIASFKSRGWKTTSSFNGGHKKTEKILTNKFPGTTTFTEENYNKIIEDYEAQIQNGEIVEGDQLMLIVDTHGGENDKTINEKTHRVSLSGEAITNFDSVGKNSVSLDKLKKLTELAKEKNIKLAIVDLSCHSGSTIELRNSHTCVITSTGPRHYAYNQGVVSFPGLFLDRLQGSKNLEDAFLSARERFRDRAFPMISTDVGVELNNEIYNVQTPYLYNHDSKLTKFERLIRSTGLEENQCLLDDDVNALDRLVNDMKLANTKLNTSSELKKFQESIVKYNAYMLKLKTEYQKLPAAPDVKESFCTAYDNGGKSTDLCWTYTINELLSMDPEIFSKGLNLKLKSLNPTLKSQAEAGLENIKKLKIRKEALIAERPDYLNRARFFSQQKDLVDKSSSLSMAVAVASRDLYFALYSLKRNTTDPNPCKDFSLNK